MKKMLSKAIESHDLNMVKKLIESGADPNWVINTRGESSLHLATLLN
ncbi:MAG: hypothetical protein DRP89_06610, partial [Candidatus Neomarinimicrobiota bacterium]